ncbi:MAG: hypothetical protein SWK90_05700 [Chloroflexota bacterium]|nr:hypothetical protein [Chloroflexota bacterium]
MKDNDKTKEQIINDLAILRKSLRQCTADLQARNRDLDDIARYVVSEFKSPMGVIVGFAELLEEDYASLSNEELCHCAHMIKQSGHKMGKMLNALLVLANSRRLSDNIWYAAYLAAMGEMPLSKWVYEEEEEVKEAYRLTCLPASAAPLVIRLWATGEEPPRLQAIAKLGSGREECEDEISRISQKVQWTLAAEEWDGLLAVVEESKFWGDPSSLEQLGWLRMVGASSEEWIFEGWRDGQHKARAVWSPDEEKAHAAYALGRSFVKSLPGWFALTIARAWVADFEPGAHPRVGDKTGLGSLL